jgi:hypothetical protein
MPSRREFLRLSLFAGLAAAGFRSADDSSALRAAKFLVSQQSADGAWRSTRYATFRDGDALTPLIARALAELGSRSLDPAIAKGMRWLEKLTDSLCTLPEPWLKLRYPLFTASEAAQLFAQRGDSARTLSWRRVIEQLRIDEALGWGQHPTACGAWSDSSAPPRLPSGTESIPDMLAPNGSATLFGLKALRSEGASAESKRALPFVFACQNFSDKPDSSFDDGGFFFALDDPIRNKAGEAGTDSFGRKRYHSFGSATCDGLLALRLCGLGFEHPRVEAALAWLRDHARGMQHAGDWPASRTSARDSLTYYYSQGLAEVLAWASSHPLHRSWAQAQCQRLIRDLEASQGPDGSWRSQFGDSCEDDPLLATTFAIRALRR